MGGQGSGSKGGEDANNYKDGRFLYRKRVRGGRPQGDKMVGHKTPPPRDKWGNITGPANPALHKASNLKVVTRAENASGPKNKTEHSVPHRKNRRK